MSVVPCVLADKFLQVPADGTAVAAAHRIESLVRSDPLVRLAPFAEPGGHGLGVHRGVGIDIPFRTAVEVDTPDPLELGLRTERPDGVCAFHLCHVSHETEQGERGGRHRAKGELGGVQPPAFRFERVAVEGESAQHDASLVALGRFGNPGCLTHKPFCQVNPQCDEFGPSPRST